MTDTEMKADCFEISQEIIENILRVKNPELIWVMLDKLIYNMCDDKVTRGYRLPETYEGLRKQLIDSEDQVAQDRLDRREKQGYYSDAAKERRKSYEGKKVVIERWPGGKSPYAREEANESKK